VALKVIDRAGDDALNVRGSMGPASGWPLGSFVTWLPPKTTTLSGHLARTASARAREEVCPVDQPTETPTTSGRISTRPSGSSMNLESRRGASLPLPASACSSRFRSRTAISSPAICSLA